MKTKIFSAMFIMAIHIMLIEQTQAQSSSDNNNPLNGKFLGYNGAQNLEFRTNNTTRMQMMQDGNSTINGFGVNRSGFLGLSQDPAFFTSGAASPFSLLHLNGENGAGNAQQLGYRDWMRYGITFTHNQDLMYIGQRAVDGMDVTDAVIAWSDNSPQSVAGPDNLTFVFTSDNGDPQNNANNLEGRENMRITADGRVGIGNFFSNDQQPHRRTVIHERTDSAQFRIAWSLHETSDLGRHPDFQVSSNANLFVKPRNNGQSRSMAVGFLADEQDPPINGAFGNSNVWTALDVGGTTRIRMLSDTAAHSIITGYYIDPENPEDNFLTRIDFPTGEDANCFVLNGEGEWENLCEGFTASDCRWLDANSLVALDELDMFTGFDPEEDCYRGKVGIGVDEVGKAKLEVENILLRDRVLVGTYSRSRGVLEEPTDWLVGVQGVSDTDGSPASQGVNVGVWGVGQDARYAIGIAGDGAGFPSGLITAYSFGVYARAQGAVNQNIGLYGEVPNASDAPLYLVGGNPVFSGLPITLSDESIKNTVEDLDNATEILLQLQPKSYYMQSPEGRYIAFDEDLQYGFLAQEVEEVLPNLVRQVTVPELRDTSGFVEGTSVDLLGVKYNEMIPLLVAAFKEQAEANQLAAGLADDQADDIAAMQEQIEAQAIQLETQAAQISALQESLATAIASIEMAKSERDHCCKDKPAAPIGPASGKVELDQNVPNPFSNQTRIDFSLPQDAHVRLVISDSQGRVLETLMDSQQPAGPHTTTWDGSRYSPGMYYYSLFANGQLLTKKMIKR